MAVVPLECIHCAASSTQSPSVPLTPHRVAIDVVTAECVASYAVGLACVRGGWPEPTYVVYALGYSFEVFGVYAQRDSAQMVQNEAVRYRSA